MADIRTSRVFLSFRFFSITTALLSILSVLELVTRKEGNRKLYIVEPSYVFNDVYVSSKLSRSSVRYRNLKSAYVLRRT